MPDPVTADDPTPAPPRFSYWIPVALVVGLVLGVAIGLLVPRGDSLPADDSAEAGFARDMTTHHTQAVEMGLIAYAQASDPEVRTMGVDIALNQQGQIGMMQAWLREWNLQPTGSQPAMAWMPDGAESVVNGLMPGMATPDEMKRLRESTGIEGDRLFLQMMIKHHLGGVHMAQEVVAVSKDKEVVEAAQLTINSQQREMTDMKSLQEKLGATS
ncbi:DUF305 domain-containing protein [Actinoplanes xinjiangensis]|uniref:Uncharacterized protein (DUF305 family) n=1 Tax=Actinoplanes xinjiangensis TaxID=512350 RepID=A0A316FPL2_9ACTN|nr:DUF305 domain-containing protein [Actinoplanes xinjiangensis]PWK50529.1 uncharacterized protein (DUF305 family) [Actinoplanes xinjiangensis]GIF36417.1 DUF305 domain-containing protein [Actinoplanes xinjiangensis]